MTSKRIHSLAESRSDYSPPRRSEPHARAFVLASDPPWLHGGVTRRLLIAGTPTDLFASSVMATAINRSPDTLRRLIRHGVVPEATYFTFGRGPYGRRRWWTRAQVLAAAEAVEAAGLLGRPRRWAGSELPALLATAATT